LKTLSVQEASNKISDLVEYTIAKCEPILISGKNKNAVHIAESEWQAMNETLHLLSVPGMRDAIQTGLSEKLESTSKQLTW
jgi:antitoxin YefM